MIRRDALMSKNEIRLHLAGPVPAMGAITPLNFRLQRQVRSLMRAGVIPTEVNMNTAYDFARNILLKHIYSFNHSILRFFLNIYGRMNDL